MMIIIYYCFENLTLANLTSFSSSFIIFVYSLEAAVDIRSPCISLICDASA